MSNVDYSQPIAGETRKGISAVPTVVWVLLAIIAVMALALGYLLGTHNESSPDVVAQETSASAQPPLDVAQPEVGTGAQLWGPSVALKDLKDPSQVHRRNPDDPFAIGKVDAPVVISEFSDFECPFCSRHANQVYPELLKYVEDGTVRIEWNDFPINGPHAVAAAKAGRAAAAQGKFEEYKTIAYAASKDVQGHPNFEIEDFVKFAKQAGVKDLEKFRAQATDSTYDSAVEAARSYASTIGITGTPAFIIGDKFVSGAQPLSAFEETIKDQLAKAKNA